MFIKGYAKNKAYPEGLAALLNATNDMIADRDPQTARAPVSIAAAGSTKAPSKGTGDGGRRQTGRGSKSAGRRWPSNRRPIGSPDWPWSCRLSRPLSALILGALWWGYRRTRSRVGAQIKEVRSKAVDVMDRLDALKERLKLLPTSPEFKEPMAGETEAFYRSVKAKNDTLWDGWLQIMEVLDKAQKLADRSGSLFSKTALERG